MERQELVKEFFINRANRRCRSHIPKMYEVIGVNITYALWLKQGEKIVPTLKQNVSNVSICPGCPRARAIGSSGKDRAVEVVMHAMELKHLLSRLLRFPHGAKHSTKQPGQAKGPAPLLDVDPFWHGDHWQNLLASPMDARHYVMEDWTAHLPDEFDTAQARSARNRRGDRRRK